MIYLVLGLTLGLVIGFFIRRRDSLRNQESFMELAKATFEKYQTSAVHDFDKKADSIGHLVKPIKESLEKVDGKILDLEKQRVGAYATLKEQVDALLQSQKDLRTETSNLVKALRAPTVRGRWGEMQLKRVVEMAGMVDHCDFYEQTQSDEGKHRPDLLVQLPGEKQIIVDAKAPLKAYLEAIEAEDDSIKREWMHEHAKQVRQHILLLSRKTYWDQFSSTPEFVVLFLPSESFFSAALEFDPELIEMGVEKQVILATPTTLIALLRSVAYGWRQEQISKNAEQISQLGRELYKRISDMGHHWVKVGKSLDSSVEAYNKAVGSLETRVLVSARRFQELDAKQVEKEIPQLSPVEQVTRVLRKDDQKELDNKQ